MPLKKLLDKVSFETYVHIIEAHDDEMLFMGHNIKVDENLLHFEVEQFSANSYNVLEIYINTLS